LRTYLLQDAAGNTLRLVLKGRTDGHELQARVVSLQVNGGTVVTPAQNTLHLRSEVDRAGHLQQVQEEVRVGAGRDQQQGQAHFSARDNQTRIEIEGGGPDQKVAKAGLVLLGLATHEGALRVTF
jgi:hypothetical protein